MPAYILIGLAEIFISDRLGIRLHACATHAITPFAADLNMVWVYAIPSLQKWDNKVSSTMEVGEQSPLLISTQVIYVVPCSVILTSISSAPETITKGDMPSIKLSLHV